MSPLEGFSHSHPLTPPNHSRSYKSSVPMRMAWNDRLTGAVGLEGTCMESNVMLGTNVYMSFWEVVAPLPASVLCMLFQLCYALRQVPGHTPKACPPSRRQRGDGGLLRWDAADLHVGEGAPALAAAVGHRGRGGDDVLQPVEGDDEQGQQEHQEAEEEPHVNIDVALAPWWGGSGRCGRGRRGETEEGPVVHWRDSGLILINQRDVHPRHGWLMCSIDWHETKKGTMKDLVKQKTKIKEPKHI